MSPCSTNEIPAVITQTETFGDSTAIDGGTRYITVYRGASTLTVQGPSYLTITFYPTTTSYKDITVTVPTSTATKTSTPVPVQTQTICRPGDSAQKQYSGLRPTHDQSITLCQSSFLPSLYLVANRSARLLYRCRRHCHLCVTAPCAAHLEPSLTDWITPRRHFRHWGRMEFDRLAGSHLRVQDACHGSVSPQASPHFHSVRHR